VSFLLLGPQAAPDRRSKAADAVSLKGLRAAVRVVWDAEFIPHVFAGNDHDAMRVLGYLHARDRFFPMDLMRRQASGTSAELLGRGALGSDILARTLGLRRAAEVSVNVHSAEVRALLDAYAGGVNAFLQDPATGLPPEYKALELTKSSVPPWTIIDSIVIAKALAFGLSFFQDAELSVGLDAAQRAGRLRGFDGTTLFFEDLVRVAPFDPTISIPGFLDRFPEARRETQRRAALEAARAQQEIIAPETLRLAEKYVATLRQARLFEGTLDPQTIRPASNWWLIGGQLTTSGYPLLASDPHMSLSTPPIWYEAHLIVSGDPDRGPMNVNGVSLPGVPGIVLGCNERVCWGATMNPLDVTDTYQERLVIDLLRFTAGTVFEGRVEPATLIPQKFKFNQAGNGTLDDLADAAVGPFEGGLTILVPRRNNGPIVSLDISNPQNVTALSIQYTGLGPTREAQTFLGFARARAIEDFKRALRFFTFGSQNWAYADVDGNIAYFTSAELPLREDLETLGRVDGTPPFLIRDGTRRYRNEWLPVTRPQPDQALPYEILPFEEMPQVVNPALGFIANANNDPIGVTLANNPLGRRRATGGIYYLSPGYDIGCRVGQLTTLIRNMQLFGEKVDLSIMASLQANHQMRDAQFFIPWLQAAFGSAGQSGAPPALAALARDYRVAEAVARLSVWDYSTPTGIREGYDPGDNPARLPEPSSEEVQHSVAATIYSVWRGQIIRNTIDATVERLGIRGLDVPDDRALSALRNLLDNFGARRGHGASGVNFFPLDGAPSPEAARDILILRSLREALDLLAGPAFAPAFERSTRMDDYRWGKLHRIVFRHALGGNFSVPPAGGFPNLGPALPGVARAGGFEVLDASGHNARAASAASFMFGGGSSRRIIAEMAPSGIRAWQIIPGGQSGLAGSPAHVNMLGRWLTNSYHQVFIDPAQAEAWRAAEERFTPAP